MNARRRSFYMIVAAVGVATLACSPLAGAAAPKTATPLPAGVTRAPATAAQAGTPAPTTAVNSSATGTPAKSAGTATEASGIEPTAAGTEAAGEPTATEGEATAVEGEATTMPEATYDTAAAQLTVPPLLTADAATAAVVSGSLRQWAASATASSQYSEPNWAASQAANAPDTPNTCSDEVNAWAAASANDKEDLELTYTQTVVPVAVNIYETYGPGSIIKVDVEEENGTAHTIYAGPPLATLQCPRTFAIGITGLTAHVNRVKIYFDQGLIGNWDEIDAVELVGNP